MRIGVKQPSVRALLDRLLTAGLEAADPAVALHRCVSRHGNKLIVGRRTYDLRRMRRIMVVGAGKASARMATALEDILGDRLAGGLIVVKYGHTAATKIIDLVEAGHPVPDLTGQRAAQRLLELSGGLSSHDVLFVLLSGGASSLLPAPAPGLTLSDKQQTTELLLRSGSSIQEINVVRKHLSTLKGGRLAAATQAKTVSLILSDVLNDDLSTIASGPTVPDPTTYADACSILRRYGVWSGTPVRVRRYLLDGRRGLHRESPKPGVHIFNRVHNEIIANNRVAVEAVAQEATQCGIQPLVLTASVTGEAKEAARVFGAVAREIATSGRPITRPACVIAGGELTVTVRGDGKGGRGQEFALAAAREIAGLRRIYIAGFGTDGTDGPTEASGAVVDGQTIARASALGLNPLKALLRNDAYPLLKQLGSLIISGPTGTNVNDLYLLLAL
jgi:glycerate 2-kinase